MKRTGCLLCLWLLLISLVAPASHGFLLPGFAPTAHRKFDSIHAEVNDIRSSRSPLQFDFYSKKLPFSRMRPASVGRQKYSSDLSLGALLSGERYQWSPYVLPILRSGCFSLGWTYADKKSVKRLIRLIDRRYRVQVVVDGLPASNRGTRVLSGRCSKQSFYMSWPKSADYERGYYLGVPQTCTGEPLLNNHVHFEITYYTLDKSEAQFYHEITLNDGSKVFREKRRFFRNRSMNRRYDSNSEDLYWIVGVSAVPSSIDWEAHAVEGNAVSDQCGGTVLTSDFGLPENKHMIQRAAMRQNFEDYEDDADFADAELAEGDDEDEPVDADVDDDTDRDTEDEADDTMDGEAEHLPDNWMHSISTKKAFNPDAHLMKLVTPTKTGSLMIHWTYSVSWKSDQTIKWATRWDAYFKHHPSTVKSSSYVASVILACAVLAGLLPLVAAVFLRTLRRDVFKRMPELLSSDEELMAQREEIGWRAIKGDVFRPPPRPNMLAIAVASGAQALLTGAASIVFGLLGLAAPGSRGSLTSFTLYSFLLSSLVGGTLCAWLSLSLGQPKRWVIVVELVLAFSGVMLLLLTLVNITLRVAGSSGALPVRSTLFLYALWLVLYCPLSVFGTAIGFSIRRSSTPTFTAVKRIVDNDKVWWTCRVPRVLWYAGLPPFLTIMFLLSLIFGGMWGGMVNYMFGIACLSGGLWVVCCALTSVIVVYYNLCGENHEWHWLSFVAPSSGGWPIAAFALWYFIVKLSISTLTGALIYMLYMSLFASLYVAVAGAIGFLSSFAFIKFLYEGTKSD